MRSKINVIRALMSVVAKRTIFLLLVIVFIISALLLVGIWALAHFVSSWWWLLLAVYMPWLIIALILFTLARFITHRMYPHAMSAEQKRLLTDFADKIQRLLETRGMGWWFFAFLCLKDLLFYQDLRTLKELINDTTSLKQAFSELERKLDTYS